jgi:hypothetical protein
MARSDKPNRYRHAQASPIMAGPINFQNESREENRKLVTIVGPRTSKKIARMCDIGKIKSNYAASAFAPSNGSKSRDVWGRHQNFLLVHF